MPGDPEETELLNIAIVPPSPVASQIIELSTLTKALGGLFDLGDEGRVPHMTVFMARFPSNRVASVRTRLADVLRRCERVKLRQAGYLLTAGNFYEVSYELEEALVRTQTMVAAAVQSLRYRPGDPVREEYFGPYSPTQQVNAELHGYDLMGSSYRPHITITRFPAAVAPPELPRAPADLSFVVDRIGLYRADPLGAATDRLYLATLD